MNLFGRKKQNTQRPNAPSLEQAVAQLNQASQQLEKREQHLLREKESARIEGQKKMRAKDKNGAIFYLRRMKMYEKQIDQLYGKRTNIDNQVMALQSASVDKDLIDSMRIASDALKANVNDEQVSRVEDMMDDIQERTQMADDISDALSRPVGYQDEIDDDELLAAFEDEQYDELEQFEEPTYNVDSIPSVPSHNVNKETSAATVDLDDELAELDALAL